MGIIIICMAFFFGCGFMVGHLFGVSHEKNRIPIGRKALEAANADIR